MCKHTHMRENIRVKLVIAFLVVPNGKISVVLNLSGFFRRLMI